MFSIIKKIFIVVLSSIVNASNHTKCVWLTNQKYMIQPTLINLYPNEYSQEFHYYPFSVKLDRCVGGNPLYLNFSKVKGYFEEINRNKYLTLVPTNESKEKIKKYEKLWIKMRDLIKSITKNLDDYDEKHENQT